MQEYHKEVYKKNISFKDFLKNHNLEILNKLTCDVVLKLIKSYMKKVQNDNEINAELNMLINNMKVINNNEKELLTCKNT